MTVVLHVADCAGRGVRCAGLILVRLVHWVLVVVLLWEQSYVVLTVTCG